MKLDLHTKSRDGLLYEAKAIYDDGKITVLKGSHINNKPAAGYTPSSIVASLLSDKTLVDENGIILDNIEFASLSTAASFVTGRTANGMIVWKTADGKYVRYTLEKEA